MLDEVIQIKVIDRELRERKIEVPLGFSLNMMEVCKASDIEIGGVCGGIGLCGTCHCFIEDGIERLGALSLVEEEVLSMLPDAQENSRLCCQIRVTRELDGLQIHLSPHAWNELAY